MVSRLSLSMALLLCSMVTWAQKAMPFKYGSPLPKEAFHGEAYINNIIASDTVYNFPQTNVITFAPGSHSNWHRHGGMDILVTGGVGVYQEEGKKAQVLRKGDVVHIPAGVRHWHGSFPGEWFQQIVIYDNKWNGNADYHDADNTVSDEYYAHLDTVDGNHPNNTDISVFAPGDSLLQLPTFTGKVRLSGTLDADNASGAPAIHNVVFEPGVYNAWHEHAGGQILIVTDGVCYHQIEGGKVEVLHPGDVAKCPPGVKHWHGAAPGSRMAHLATNTNPEKKGVKWYGFLSKDDYDKPGKILAVAKIYSQQFGVSTKEAMAKLYQSNTYRKLEDESTKLWHYGPVALYQEFLENN